VKYSASSYVQNIRNALDILHRGLPRTFVNMVPTIDITGSILLLIIILKCNIFKFELTKKRTHLFEKKEKLRKFISVIIHFKKYLISN
jgi:hypothetical protein